eukprot:6902619-Prymnesium_polylepis.1
MRPHRRRGMPVAERDGRRRTTVWDRDPRTNHGGGSALASGRRPRSGHTDAAAPLGPGRRARGAPRDTRDATHQG